MPAIQFSRRTALKRAAAFTTAALPALADQNVPLRFTSLANARTALAQLMAAKQLRSHGGMTPYSTLVHCAQSIEYSLVGYPQNKPVWFRATVGQAAARVFLWRGMMSHDLTAPIPGAPVIVEQAGLAPAFARLQMALNQFEQAVAAGKPLAPHFAYGDVSPADYARLHAMHLAEHFGSLQVV